MELIQNRCERYRVLPQVELQRDVSAEVIVPDTQADVYSILTTYARCQVKQKTLHKGQIFLEGIVEIETLCQGEEAGWQRIRGSVPFSIDVEVPGCSEDSVIPLRVEVLRCEAQIRNPRKLLLQAQLGIFAQPFSKESLLVSESVHGGEEECLQYQCRAVELEVIHFVAEKKLIAADEMQTGVSGQLLHYTVDWHQEEQRILAGKVMLRGNACVRVLYLREEQFLQQEYQIPFSQTVECAGLDSGDSVVVEYHTLQSQITMLEGETPVISCNLTGDMTVCVLKKMQFQILQDFYSTRYETECERSTLSCPTWIHMERIVPVEDLCQPQERVVSILDCRVRGRGFADESGHMGGIYTITVLYCCQEGHMHSAEHTIKVLCEDRETAKQMVVRAGWKDLSAQAVDGGIRFRFSAVLKGKGLAEQPCEQVVSCSLDTTRQKIRPAPGTLILRAAEEGETPWSLAKHYGTRSADILEANGLTENRVLTLGQLMIIPFVH